MVSKQPYLNPPSQDEVIHPIPMWESASPEAPIVVGVSVERKDAWDKVTGKAEYIDDLPFNGGLHGVTVRSQIARGKILKIEFQEGVPWNEVVVVSASDIPGENVVATILEDQPILARDFVNHPEEPILLLAHANREIARRARDLVKITYEEWPPIFDIEESLKAETIIWGKDNCLKAYEVSTGQIDSVWSQAHKIIEAVYRTGAQEQLYIENNGAICWESSPTGVTVMGSLQCPYYVNKGLARIFGLPPEKVRVLQAETGGGFGGKEDYPTLICAHAALLSWKAKKPVKIIYDRAEDLAATTKRHPSRTKHKTAVDRDGRLLAMEIDFVLDGGAYATLSSVVLSRGTLHALGPYRCPHVRIHGKAVATNAPPHGAFRGFGVPQSMFAVETHMDYVARHLNLSPEEFRRRNFIHDGDTFPTGQVIKDQVSLDDLLTRALKECRYHDKQVLFKSQNSGARFKKGLGFSTFMHGAGFTGSGEKYLASVAGIRATPQGRVEVLVANTEIGQGARTVLSQIVADTLRIPYEWVDWHVPDTGVVPNSGPTVASRTSMVVGRLVESAARGFLEILRKSEGLATPHSPQDFEQKLKSYLAKHATLRCHSQFQPSPDIEWDDKTYRGDAYGTYAWAAYVAEVTVDTLTYHTRVDHFWAVQEIGKVLHPKMAAGQIEGGVAQAIGFALFEDTQMVQGKMKNNQLTNYIIPTSADLPTIETFFEESPYQRGPWGAKGIGELPLDGGAPAVANAVSAALGGYQISCLPIRPEDLMMGHIKSPEKSHTKNSLERP